MFTPITSLPATGGGLGGYVVRDRRRFGLPLRPVSLLVLVILVLASLGGWWGARSVVHDQENRLLKERTNEVVAVLTLAVNNAQSSLGAVGTVARVTRGASGAFTDAVTSVLAAQGPNPNPPSYSLVQQTGTGLVVRAAVGKTLHVGERITGVEADAITRAMKSGRIVSTPVLGTGANRALGLALAGPSVPPHAAIYERSTLGKLSVSPRAATSPFSELDVVLYASTHPDPAQVLLTTNLKLPLRGHVDRQLMPVGTGSPDKWLMVVVARKPLVGSIAWRMPWFVLGGLLLAGLLIAFAIETVARRRDLAVELYETEHGIAERLQRSLLPALPLVPGLDLAARYIAGGRGQEVGGDWFDVFRVAGDSIGVAIGDVIGHDLAAATAMAQLRSALRAYAFEGEEPAMVVDRLDKMVDNFALAQLVTVVYGVLEPPDETGGRRMRFANAGHLSPVVLDPNGQVHVLDSVASVIIGAPLPADRAQSEHYLEVGSTMLLFTDGLVEIPGTTLDVSLSKLSDTLQRHGTSGSVEDLCDAVLSEMAGIELRDDIALLAVRVVAPA